MWFSEIHDLINLRSLSVEETCRFLIFDSINKFDSTVINQLDLANRGPNNPAR